MSGYFTAKGARAAEKDLDSRRRDCQDGKRTHVRVGRSWIPDDVETPDETVGLVGLASDLHGPTGVCTCCHGRRADS